MAEGEGGGGGGLIETIFTSLFDLLSEAIGAILSILPKILKFILWVLLAIIVLPCVFIAGTVYPWWVEMGEGF